MKSNRSQPKCTFVALLALVACNSAPTNPIEKSGPASKTEVAKAPTQKAEAKDPHAGHVMPGTEPKPEPKPEPVAPSGDRYDLVLTTDPATPLPNSATRLSFDPQSAGARVGKLAIVHEKPLHLIIVSRDLSFFAHEHPELQPDGTYALGFEFPAPGDYVLFGDFTPEGAEGQVVRMPVRVEGTALAAKPLAVEDRAAAKTLGALEVKLEPADIVAGADTMLAFTIGRGGKPQTGLRPYLGAMGHCVIIDESATSYLHSHPMEDKAAGPTNVVQFHTVFPKAGKYKVWGQFDVGGQMLIADFVVDVGEGKAAPPDGDPHAGHPH